MTRTVNPLWTAYNAVQNEGGEGYNPHPQYIGETPEPKWAALDRKAAKLLRILNGMSDQDPRYAAKEAEYQATLAEAKAALDAEI